MFEHCRDLVCGIPGSWTYRRCGACSSLWMDPLPRPEEIPSFYPEKYYTHEAAEFSGPVAGRLLGRLTLPLRLAALEARFGYAVPSAWWRRAGGSGWVRPMQALLPMFPIARMIRFLPFQQGGRLLDVGSGSGEFLALMRELGWEVEGIEPDGRAVEKSAKAGLRVRHGGIESTELEPEAYDAITLSHVIEHLLDPRAAMERLVGALRPGGLLVSLSPNPSGWNARSFQGIWRGLEPPRHLILPSRSGYQTLLKGLPVKVELSTSPMQMGAFRKWSWEYKRSGRAVWVERAYAFWLDYFGGPLRVAVCPDDGEECVCVARKER